MRGLGGVAFRSIRGCLSRRSHAPYLSKPLSTGNWIDNSAETNDEFERRMFDTSSDNRFYERLDKVQKPNKTSGPGPFEGHSSQVLDELDESFSTLTDGIDGKLKKEATYFHQDMDEIDNDPNYEFRPDIKFQTGQTYDIKDLDLRKPGVRKPFKRYEFKVTTEEVLRNADFRNVQFLANFITEAGILIKRSKTGISAKAQRKVAREIKTARAFGLMPFTTMGTKPFFVGKTMETLDSDFEYPSYDNSFSFVSNEANEKDPLVNEANEKDPLVS